MIIYRSCSDAISACIATKRFAAAHLYNDEKPMKIHIHDCYEIYYSIAGGRQFLIDNRFYNFHPGDVFFINQYESHYLSQIDRVTHERIVFTIYPDYLKSCCTKQTDLNQCFTKRNTPNGHKLSLSVEEQRRFLYYFHKFKEVEPFGEDIWEHAYFLELMTFLNKCFCRANAEAAPEGQKESPAETPTGVLQDLETPEKTGSHYAQIDALLSYVNQNLTEDLTIQSLADHFFLSPSYLCRLFKSETGTTINRYITAKRITCAKSLLADGCSVADACERSGFNDYSNFLRAFTKAVGISPKKYTQFER